ncbi:MAG: autoinducer binding domain-containing protein [Shimia sp.]
MGTEVHTAEISSLSPDGHYLAIRIGFAFPIFEENRLPRDWVDHYTAAGMMIGDPVVAWMYGNTGFVRWSEIALPDPRGVWEQAHAHGLRFGGVCSCADPETGERSYGSFVRRDREFTDHELARLYNLVEDLHVARKRPDPLTPAETEALRLVRDGMRFKEIAHLLGISESAVKARLTNAKKKLGAKTSVQAVSIASEFSML